MSSGQDILYLGRADMAKLGISSREMVDEIETLIRGCAAGEVWNLPKTVIHPDSARLFMSTLAVTDRGGLAACKSLGLSQLNSERGLDHINALVTLFESSTGRPLAVMDGNWITAVRTAAISGLAARYLARRESSVITFIGCGVQARSHLDCFAELFPLAEIRAVGRGRENLERLCDQARERGLRAVTGKSPADALTGADLVVTTVSHAATLEPFLAATDLGPGTFVTMVDLMRPWQQPTLPAFDRIYIEDLEQERTMPAPMVDLAMVNGDLHDLINDESAGRRTPDERVAFAFRGLALGDLGLAALAYRAARRQSVGTWLPR